MNTSNKTGYLLYKISKLDFLYFKSPLFRGLQRKLYLRFESISPLAQGVNFRGQASDQTSWPNPLSASAGFPAYNRPEQR